MIFLEREHEEFARTKEKFREAFETLLENAKTVVAVKGISRDRGSPVHHRMNPMTMLALAQAKGRRIEALMTDGRIWWRDQSQLDKIIEECSDASNYLLFIAALCTMLEEENRS